VFKNLVKVSFDGFASYSIILPSLISFIVGYPSTLYWFISFSTSWDSSEQSISEISLGIMKKEYGTLFVNESWTPFGTSQTTIASIFSKSIRTISRRLKSASKIKVAFNTKQTFHEYDYYQFKDKEDWTNLSSKYFISNGLVFKRMVSLYQPILSLTTKKYSLSKLKKKFVKESC
jgi:hypothetical protein